MGTSKAMVFHPSAVIRRRRSHSGKRPRIFATLTAIDLRSGRIKWQRQIPEGSNGGCSSSESGLTFYGDSEGYFNAVETQTGNPLWRFQTGAGVNAPPIIYKHRGREYVTVISSGSRQGIALGDAVVTFALPVAK